MHYSPVFHFFNSPCLSPLIQCIIRLNCVWISAWRGEWFTNSRPNTKGNELVSHNNIVLATKILTWCKQKSKLLPCEYFGVEAWGDEVNITKGGFHIWRKQELRWNIFVWHWCDGRKNWTKTDGDVTLAVWWALNTCPGKVAAAGGMSNSH